MTNNSQALRSETVARSIWDGFYKDPVDTVKKEYLVALALLHTIRSPFVTDAFYSGTPASKSQLVEAHADFLDKAMTLVSVLFSAINSPLRIFASLSKKEMLYDMRNAISFIESKCNSGTVQPSPAEKEVLIACYMMLCEELKGLDANKSFYGDMALNLVNEVLRDQATSSTTRVLTQARASLMNQISLNARLDYKDAVLDVLFSIKKNPGKIVCLDQGWKTYVRLARMVFAWRLMFFGLKYDDSKDLKWKSWCYFLRYCYK